MSQSCNDGLEMLKRPNACAKLLFCLYKPIIVCRSRCLSLSSLLTLTSCDPEILLPWKSDVTLLPISLPLHQAPDTFEPRKLEPGLKFNVSLAAG